MKLTTEQRRMLIWLGRQTQLMWGGIYERGGDDDVAVLVERGLIERVAEPYTVGRAEFQGGFRITPAGRRALEGGSDG